MAQFLLATLLATGLPHPTLAQAAPTAQATDADVETLVDAFVLEKPLRDILHGGCDTAYRTKLSKSAADQQVEQALPGIHERMVAAASAFCDRRIASYLTAARDRVRADIKTMWTPAERARLARLLGPAVEEAKAAHIEFREGDMATDAAKRSVDPATLAAQEAGLASAQAEFARAPGGAALLDQIAAYQAKTVAENNQAVQSIVVGALRAAHAVANAYAREKGADPVYPDG